MTVVLVGFIFIDNGWYNTVHALHIVKKTRRLLRETKPHIVSHTSSMIKNQGGRPIKPPPIGWRPDLTGAVRETTWMYAAGLNPDGSQKNADQHKCTRSRINQMLRLETAAQVQEST
jgi:hypothetical protein